MKHPAPNPGGTSAEHWKQAAEGRLALPHCTACKRFHWPPRARCPHCRGEADWRSASGKGRVVSFSIVHRAVNPELNDDAPYVVAFVELDEGVRIFSNVVGVEPEAVRTGMRVRCRFETALDAALRVPVLAPEGE